VQIHIFLAPTLLEVSGQLHASAALPPWKKRQVPTGQVAGCAPEPVQTKYKKKIVDPTGTRNFNRSPPPPPPPRHPARSQPLYRLRYHGSLCDVISLVLFFQNKRSALMNVRAPVGSRISSTVDVIIAKPYLNRISPSCMNGVHPEECSLSSQRASIASYR
jgi:hypothetical protein